jgi:hypothetical protein
MHFSSTVASPLTVSPRDRLFNLAKVRTVNKRDAVVIAGKTGNFATAMLSNSKVEIICHAGVQHCALFVAHHVNPVIVISRQFVRSFDSASLRSG